MEQNVSIEHKKIWIFIVGGCGILLIVVVVGMLMAASSRKPTKLEGQVIPGQGTQNSGPPISRAKAEELKKAIASQMSVDQEYAGWQKSVATDFPWLKKLPLTSPKYYVYYDLNAKAFIGRLYPVAGDNVDQIKADIMKDLKEVKKVAVEQYRFEWTVKPL